MLPRTKVIVVLLVLILPRVPVNLAVHVARLVGEEAVPVGPRLGFADLKVDQPAAELDGRLGCLNGLEQPNVQHVLPLVAEDAAIAAPVNVAIIRDAGGRLLGPYVSHVHGDVHVAFALGPAKLGRQPGVPATAAPQEERSWHTRPQTAIEKSTAESPHGDVRNMSPTTG